MKNISTEKLHKNKKIVMDFKLITNIKVEGIHFNDYPDFVDAYIDSAEYDGVEMTDEQLDELNENSEFVHDCVYNQLF